MLRLLRPLCITLCLLVSAAGLTLPSAAAYPALSGECACLYLPANDRFLYEKNADRRHPMASTTKIMTALVALENSDPADTVTIPQEAVGVEGSSIYLQAGEKHTVENLLYALLLSSANDTAVALAIHTAGSIDAFADMMNDRAEALGLTDTHFENPHGLHSDTHYTTAADLARIGAAAMENESFCRIVSTKNKVIKTCDGSVARSLSNHNRLLRQYEDCVGIKTGFTKTSGRCLVSAAERDGMLLIAVTLDAPNDWQDHHHLLDYGFSQYEGRVLHECAGLSLSLPVIGGVESEVTVCARHTPTVVLPKSASPIEYSLEVNRFAVAPVRRGETLGLIRYTQDGKTVATVPLLAESGVAAQPQKFSLWDKIQNIWNR